MLRHNMLFLCRSEEKGGGVVLEMGDWKMEQEELLEKLFFESLEFMRR